jgi:hypothetical protein
MAQIPLLNRRREVVAHALVDDVDYARLSVWMWHLGGRVTKRYARRNIVVDGRLVAVLMHREVLGLPRGSGGRTTGDRVEGDHINGDGLDNHRDNLRRLTHADQMQNKRPSRGSTSRFRGVHWRSKDRLWKATVRHKGREHSAGYFKSEVAAAEAAKQLRASLMPYAIEAA